MKDGSTVLTFIQFFLVLAAVTWIGIDLLSSF
jgi:hypothetical protein